jgi:hypothetical protein
MKAHFASTRGPAQRERFRICEVPKYAQFFHTVVLLMPSRPTRLYVSVNAAQLLRGDGSTTELKRHLRHSVAWNVSE